MKRLRMNSYARKHMTPDEYAAVEAAIPDGYFVAVQARNGAGDWSLRIFLDNDECDLIAVSRGNYTIAEPALAFIARYTHGVAA